MTSMPRARECREKRLSCMARVHRASLLVAATSLFVAMASTMPIPTQKCAKCRMAGTKAKGRHPLLFAPILPLLPLRGGAVIVEDARGMCPETGPWLEEFDMPHEQVFTCGCTQSPT